MSVPLATPGRRLAERAHLHAAQPHQRQAGGQPQRLVQVAGAQQHHQRQLLVRGNGGAVAQPQAAVAGAQESSSGASDADPDLIVDTIPVGEDDAPELPESERDDPVLNLGTLTVSGDKLGRSLAETNTSVGLITGEAIDAGSDSNLQEVVSQIGP